MRELSPVEWAVLPLKKYAVFSGRAPRAEYWWSYLACAVVSFGLELLDGALGLNDIIGSVFSLAVLVPSLAVTVRRLHDIDRTGWWLFPFVGVFGIIGMLAVFAGFGSGQPSEPSTEMLIAIIVVVIAMLAIAITLLVFMIQEGTPGDNRYGPDPYAPDHREQAFA